jgi:hypothetical protein
VTFGDASPPSIRGATSTCGSRSASSSYDADDGSSERAAILVKTLETMTVTSTTTSVALSRFSSKMPASVPIVTAASVAAACATVRP